MTENLNGVRCAWCELPAIAYVQTGKPKMGTHKGQKIVKAMPSYSPACAEHERLNRSWPQSTREQIMKQPAYRFEREQGELF